MRALGLTLSVLALAAPVAAQNAVTGAVQPKRLTASFSCLTPPNQPALVAGAPPTVVRYCSGSDWPAAALASGWKHILFIDGREFRLSSVTCTDTTPGAPYQCYAPLDDGAKALFTQPGTRVITVAVENLNSETNLPQRSAMSAPLQVATSPNTCQYAPPGSTVMQTRPNFRDDPVMGSMQGYNPLANQVARVAQLRSWGWEVQWQADFLTQKVLLFIFCNPVSQVAP